MKTKKKRYGWYLFDFANSVLIINGGLYFPQWIVVDHGVSDVYFNITITAAAIFVFTVAPIIGLLADRRFGYVAVLRLTTAAMLLAASVLSVLPFLEAVTPMLPVLALVSFFFIMSGYQLSLTVYNAMLARVAAPRSYSVISGFGLASGWLGGVFGVIAILPFVEGYFPFLPEGRAGAFLPSTVLSAALILLSLYLIGNERDDPKANTANSMKGVYPAFWIEVKNLIKNKILVYFLLAYVLFAEGVLTIQNNSTIYMEIVMGYDDRVKALLFLIILGMAAIGGIVSGYGSRKYGVKPLLFATLLAWSVFVFLVSVIEDKIVVAIIFAVLGFLFGCVWNLSRVLFLYLIPQQKRGQYFGLYSSFERATSMLGPVLWSVPLLFIAGPFGYRIAMAGMAVLLLASALVFLLVKGGVGRRGQGGDL